MTKSCTLNELAALVRGEVAGDGEITVRGLNGVDYASPYEITFITSSRKIPEIMACRAGAAIVPEDCAGIHIPCIRVANPDLAAAVIHNHFLSGGFTASGIDPAAAIGRDCAIPEAVSIGPMVCIGDRVRLGDQITIHPGVVIGSDCVIGSGTVLHANVSIADRTVIGSRVIIHSGASIGSDGFGYATGEDGRHVKKPQVGNVRIDDDVEIGANSCVDRAAFGTTRIRRGTKIDNLVMVAHNVEIGENAIVVAQAGIAGSTTTGSNVVLGAQAGVAGHLHIGDRAMVAAKSGVHGSLKNDSVVAGYPAIDIAKWRRSTVSYARLPDMLRDLKNLRREVERLAAQLRDDGEKKKREEE
jgi:UDP-3-O-[3-hydroxymyristoyl] glucosamine N-acyltransferase